MKHHNRQFNTPPKQPNPPTPAPVPAPTPDNIERIMVAYERGPEGYRVAYAVTKNGRTVHYAPRRMGTTPAHKRLAVAERDDTALRIDQWLIGQWNPDGDKGLIRGDE